MYHIKMLQCSCYGISNYRIRFRKSCSQLEKIVNLELESTDLEYCILHLRFARHPKEINLVRYRQDGHGLIRTLRTHYGKRKL